MAARVAGASRVAVWAVSSLETVVAVVGALAAGVPIVPINPKAGTRELEHILGDSSPELIFGPASHVRGRPLRVRVACPSSEPDDEAPAIVVYTSGTTGPPKGVVLPRRALASNLDALSDAWDWGRGRRRRARPAAVPRARADPRHARAAAARRRARGISGASPPRPPLRRLSGRATMLFGVPTMYHRLAADLEASLVAGCRRRSGARLLVSGSAALPARDHARISAACGLLPVERYGMSETLMNTAIRADGDRRPGTVGVPLAGVSVRLVDDSGAELDVSDDSTVGEIQVRGPNLFLEYLNRPDATAEAMRDRLVRDRRRRDAFGGRLHPDRRAARDRPDQERRLQDRGGGDRERAARAPGRRRGGGHRRARRRPRRADRRLGRDRGRSSRPGERELADHVASLLTPHKRPRVVRYLDELPRNAMGKVTKATLGS